MIFTFLSYSGKVGKTSLTAQFQSMYYPTLVIKAVESINLTAAKFGCEVDTITGDDFGGWFDSALDTEDGIIDIGASNIENFLIGMVGYKRSHKIIDRYIVPTVNGEIEKEETIRTINKLHGIGIPSDSIFIIPNKVVKNPEKEFKELFNYANIEKRCTITKDAVVYKNDLFDLLSTEGITIRKVLDDKTDYEQMLKDSRGRDMSERQGIVSRLKMQMLAESVVENLSKVFDVIGATGNGR